MSDKRTRRPEDVKKTTSTRLNRIDGQLHGIKKMVDEDKYCDDILIQLSAVNKSIKSLANYILENHMYNCVLNDMENGKVEIIDEVVKLFRTIQ